MGKAQSTGKNVTAVQTPGATAATDTATDQTNDAMNAADAATPDTAPKSAFQKVEGESKATNRPTRAQYLQMRASDVDPATLTQAVLTKDGWVCPVKAPSSK